MVKVTAPCLSISSSPPLRKKRVPFTEPVHTPFPEQVLVTAGDPAPDPDCTGTYLYYRDQETFHAYRRTPGLDFFIFWDPGANAWVLSVDPDAQTMVTWKGQPGPAGEYYASGLNTSGIAIASAPFIP
jgi:hypothetical protein